ncbi:MAG: TonB-dependent receptor plug domain-containing protein [Polyangiaceae bacterium]|nr:TonB-dependent receptor plug domain-containing protein [Polyangiaceae bacterium]
MSDGWPREALALAVAVALAGAAAAGTALAQEVERRPDDRADEPPADAAGGAGGEPVGPGEGGGLDQVPQPGAEGEPREAPARGGGEGGGPAAPPPDAAAIDVVVEGEGLDREEQDVHAPSQRSLTDREYSRIPGAFGDAFRAIEALPGVTPMASGLPALLVRGSSPSATGYYLDGIQVPFLFHLLVGPSVLHPAIVERVDFYPGAYPSRFGRQAGGIVSAATHTPSPELRLEGSLRLFDAGVYADVPLDDGRAHVFLGGRYSYTAALFALVAPSVRLAYWDYQGGASYAPSPRDRVRVFAFGSHDFLGKADTVTGEDGSEETEVSELFAADFHRVELRLEHTPLPDDAGGAHRLLAFDFGYDRTGLGAQGAAKARAFGARAEADVVVSPEVRFRGGIDLEVSDHRFETDASDEPPAKPSRMPKPKTTESSGFQFDLQSAFRASLGGDFGAWVDAVLRPVPELELVPGTRLDAFSEAGVHELGVDPRLALRVRPLDWLALVAAGGIAHQRGSVGIAVPGLEPAGLHLQRAVQLSTGAELELPEEVHVGATFFHHAYAAMSDVIAACGPGVTACDLGDRAGGRSFGLELSVSRSFSERVAGMLSYTLSRSLRTVGSRTFLSDFDRTHILHLALGFNLGAGWNAGARLTAYSGKPYSLVAFEDPDDPTDPTLIGRRNALRGPPFHRLDLRVEKRWIIEDMGFISLVLEGMNVTLRKEQLDFDCRVAEALGDIGLGCGQQSLGPVAVPSLGVVGGL